MYLYAGLLTVYDAIDSVRVEPDYGIARVGGGSLDAVTAQFVDELFLLVLIEPAQLIKLLADDALALGVEHVE